MQSSAVIDAGSYGIPQKDRLIATELLAHLRLADGLDMSHTARVIKVTLKEKQKNRELTLIGRGDLMLEKRALNRRRDLLR